MNIIDGVGNTPLVELKTLSDDVAPVKIYGKAEWYNPGGSVKDRPALNMVREGEKSGKLTKDKILLDATSGNTGIAYAMIGSALGYRVKLAVPRNIGDLRRRILEVYGADLVLSAPELGSDGAIEKALEIYNENPDLYFYPDQYNNDANWQAHYNGTALEIIEQTEGKLTHFVAGLGTSGTFTGTSRRLREFNSDIRLISFEPDSPMHGIEGMKHMPTSIVPGIYDDTIAHENREVRTEDAQAMIRRLAQTEGMLLGISAGAAVHCAYELAKEL
ncbi:MAG: cysteine synthase family protein, partial [Verrucomicrobiota bacterium]